MAILQVSSAGKLGTYISLERFIDSTCSGHWGKLGSYDGNGYIQDLSLDANRSRCILECLKENDWLDRQTRVVFVDIVTYNPNLRYFLAGRWLLEAPAGGGMVGL